MRITADTNLLVRLVVGDAPEQEMMVRNLFRDAERIVIAVSSLCELFWVLRTRYRFDSGDIHKAISGLLGLPRIDLDGEIVDAGLALLQAGGDFSDGVIACEGRRRGGETFVTFDRRAIRKLTHMGLSARQP
jgi:predicted nucleic-acid-binding protein